MRSSHRYRRIWTVALVGFMLGTVACAAGSPEASSPAASGESRFLVTSPSGILEMVEGHSKILVASDDDSLFFDLAISRDGKAIAFSRQAPASRDARGELDFGSDLMVADLKTGEAREVIHHAAVGEFIRTPAFLKSGDLLFGVFGSRTNGEADFHIDRFNPKDGQRSRLIDNALNPAVTPDDQMLAYVSRDRETAAERIVVRNLRSGKDRELVPDSALLALIQSLVWSPDGEVLAFAAADLSSAVSRSSGSLAPAHPSLQDLWLVRADGSGLTRVAEVAESALSIAWAADGTALYVMGGGAFARYDVKTGAREDLAVGVPSGQIARLP